MRLIVLSASALMLGILPAAPAAAQDSALIATNLYGKYMVGGGATEDGGGDFNGEIDFSRGQVCYYFEAYGIDGADAAHIHQGAQGETGPAVLTLAVPGEDADEVCVEADDALLRAIAANPAGYYADIHTPAHTEAALRGQLRD